MERSTLILGATAAVVLLFFMWSMTLPEVESIPIEVTVEAGSELGFNISTEIIQFGRMAPTSGGARTITLENTRKRAVRIDLYAEGALAEWVRVPENGFLLKPGTSETFKISLAVPSSALDGLYTGALQIRSTPQVSIISGFAVGSIDLAVAQGVVLGVSPNSISKSSTPGSTVTETITMNNTGDLNSSNVTLTTPGSWATFDTNNFALNTGAEQAVVVSLISSTAGTFTGQINITTVNGSTTTVPVSFTVTAAAEDTPASSGGGGGGGGKTLIKGEGPVEKILPLKPLEPEGPITVIVEEPLDVDITEVQANVIHEVRNGFLRITNYRKEKPAQIRVAPDGVVLAYADITPINFATSVVENVEITFRASRTAIEAAKLAPEQVALYHYLGQEWVELDTRIIRSSQYEIVYSSISPSLSYFAIAESGLKEPSASVKELPVTLTEDYELFIRYTRLEPNELGLIKLRVLNKGPVPLSVSSKILAPVLWSIDQRSFEQVIPINTEAEFVYSIIPHKEGVYFVTFEGSIADDPFRKTIAVTVEKRILGLRIEDAKFLTQLMYLVLVISLFSIIAIQQHKIRKHTQKKRRQN